MRASIKWLKDYVDFKQSPEELADMLTMAGVPVEKIEYRGQGLAGIVTGKITDIQPHPNADKLSVCKVDVKSEKLTIVTGATNVRAGQVVPVALVGTVLPGGKEIKEAVLRGVSSKGMLCSVDELALDTKTIAPELREGIYILPEELEAGIDIRQALGLDDVVLEFELTANRADCFSMLGLAREIAVLTGGTLKKPMLTLKETGTGKASAQAEVEIVNHELCSRFAARMLQNVKIGPSPVWLQQRIQAAGMRPISNVVDVTNFVMLEMGQPMHAYDYNLLARHRIIVRSANPGERLTTLDGIKRELNPDMLVIADAVQAVGIAGVMGGLATEVTANTQNVLLEAAAFNNVSIRRTSRALGLRSEASGRFERGVDVANVVRALDRAAKLLEEMGACKVCPGMIDNYPAVALPRQVAFTPEEINAHLGTGIAKNTMLDILRKLEFEIDATGGKVTATVPSWRSDVSLPSDISEEVARIYGFNNIKATTPSGTVRRGGQSYTQMMTGQIKDILSSAGFNEIISFSFTHPAVIARLNLADSEAAKAIEVLNPITEEFPLMRTTLLGGILDTIVRNLSRKNDDLKIFEVGAVFKADSLPLQELPAEPLMLCGALSGRRHSTAWNQSREMVDFYDAKGAVEILLRTLGIDDYEVIAGEHPSFHPGRTAMIMKDGRSFGVVGEIHPQVLDAFDIGREVYAFEISMKELIGYSNLTPRYCPLQKYPAITRDLAVVLQKSIDSGLVMKEIKNTGVDILKSVTLFDVYTGEQVPAGERSLAFSLLFQAEDRTLTDPEIDREFDKILVRLQNNLSARIRI